jgi:hypothetical protein
MFNFQLWLLDWRMYTKLMYPLWCILWIEAKVVTLRRFEEMKIFWSHKGARDSARFRTRDCLLCIVQFSHGILYRVCHPYLWALAFSFILYEFLASSERTCVWLLWILKKKETFSFFRNRVTSFFWKAKIIIYQTWKVLTICLGQLHLLIMTVVTN